MRRRITRKTTLTSPADLVNIAKANSVSDLNGLNIWSDFLDHTCPFMPKNYAFKIALTSTYQITNHSNIGKIKESVTRFQIMFICATNSRVRNPYISFISPQFTLGDARRNGAILGTSIDSEFDAHICEYFVAESEKVIFTVVNVFEKRTVRT
jgi:hypothetical protein